MSTGEIYQWFRDNTDKTSKHETKTRKGKNSEGWQHSIRHNLSMNQAFTRVEHEETLDLTQEAAEKTSNETCRAQKQSRWKMKDWAVKNGVQSTTKYRQRSLTRKAARSRTHHRPYDHGSSQPGSPVSAKATYDSKGDHSTSKLGLRCCHCHGTNMLPASYDIMVCPPANWWMAWTPGIYQPRQVHKDMAIPLIAGPLQTSIKQEVNSHMETDAIGHEAFGFILTPPDLVLTYAASSGAVNNYGTSVHALFDGAQDTYAGASLCGFPNSVSDATNPYQGGSGGYTTSGELSDLHMNIGPDAAHSWSFQRLFSVSESSMQTTGWARELQPPEPVEVRVFPEAENRANGANFVSQFVLDNSSSNAIYAPQTTSPPISPLEVLARNTALNMSDQQQYYVETSAQSRFFIDHQDGRNAVPNMNHPNTASLSNSSEHEVPIGRDLAVAGCLGFVDLGCILKIRQQPVAARMCGRGSKDRRYLDPPPILELTIEDPNMTQEEKSKKLRNSRLTVSCSILDESGAEEVPTMNDESGKSRQLIGSNEWEYGAAEVLETAGTVGLYQERE
ncbi:hypothetical protein FSARC_583 [Fusarium sarcochroum]|uniref:Uncharacterized protein n=1 Tax=Fusarium sarcochroum TaxID=1208366 RepID=A0A8H4XG51_9HYPO|nr:hypothetical protein FSARC_583 [Fusarium sarcochroum]